MKILFLSHDASRTGAPIVLLNLIRWFKENSSIPFEILLKNGGELEDAFSQLGRCTIYNDERAHSKQNRLESIISKWVPLGIRKTSLLNAYKNSDVRLVYSNTITNGDLLEQLSLLKCKVITHVHELENYIHICGEDNLNKVKKHTNFYIAPSHAVKDNLVLN